MGGREGDAAMLFPNNKIARSVEVKHTRNEGVTERFCRTG